MTEKPYRLNKWSTKLLKNNKPLFDWANEGDNIVDLLNTQHETIQNLNQRIDDYLTEVNYQLEQGTDFKDTYVRYSRFKQILEELKGVLNND